MVRDDAPREEVPASRLNRVDHQRQIDESIMKMEIDDALRSAHAQAVRQGHTVEGRNGRRSGSRSVNRRNQSANNVASAHQEPPGPLLPLALRRGRVSITLNGKVYDYSPLFR